VSWCVPPWVYPSWDSLCFLDMADNFLSHVGEVFSYYLFKYFLRFFLFLSSFWDSYTVNTGAFNVVPEVKLLGCLRFFSFFFLYSVFSIDFHHSVLQATYLFFCLSFLLLVPSSVLFISHANKVMLKILQAKLQQYRNQKLPDVQVEF